MADEKAKCSCGLSAVVAFRAFDRIREELRKDEPSAATVITIIRDDLNRFMLNNIERDCKLDLTGEKHLLEGADKDAIDQNWGHVQGQILNADFQTWDKLFKCAEREG